MNKLIMFFKLLILCVVITACGTGGGQGNTSEGAISGGNTSGGDTSGGDTSDGNTSGGNTSGGDTSGGDTSDGNTSGGNTSDGNTSGGDTSDGNTSDGNTSGGDTPTLNTVEKALASGDVRNGVTEAELVAATLNTLSAEADLLRGAKNKIFNLNSDGSAKSDGSSLVNITWSPGVEPASFTPQFGQSTSLLRTNAVTTEGYPVLEKDVAIIGEKQNGGGRYLVFGDNPMHILGNADMEKMLENAIAWLTKRNDLKSAPFNAVLAHMSQRSSFPHEVETRRWLDNHYGEQVTYNSANTCEGAQLAVCITAATDIVIISQSSSSNVTEAVAAIEQALSDGIPVIYLQRDDYKGDLLEALVPNVLSVNYEGSIYSKKLQVLDFDPANTPLQLPLGLRNIQVMFQHFKDNDYSTVDLSICDDRTSCDKNPDFSVQFLQGAEEVQRMINQLDIDKINVFDSAASSVDYTLEKLLVLTADKMRESIVYPMDRATTDYNTVLKSLYADHVVHSYRTHNPAQPNMGNFSRSDFSHITPVNRTVAINSREDFRSTGAYALPGQSFTVTRNDNSALTVKVFINTLRRGATRLFLDSDHYNRRPKYLESQHITVNSGETITLTSPYGGPIQLEFSESYLPVNVTFTNVGEHPYWASAADDDLFDYQLSVGDYDWAELVTTDFEVHSTLSLMRESVEHFRWGSAAALASGTEQYMSDYPHAIAGFQGPRITPIPEVHDFASLNGWTIDTVDIVKHMNADQSTCGSRCSGNPFDSNSAFNPVSGGDIHELAHGLDDSRFRFSGWGSHDVIGIYVWATQAKYNEAATATTALGCYSMDFESYYNLLQSNEQAGTTAPETDSGMMLVQAFMSAQKAGALTNGWHMTPRLHVLEREFVRAIASDALWLSKRSELGFDDYTLGEAKAISNDDWMTIAMSYVTGQDFRDFLTMWGISYSTQASDQVASFVYPAIPREYFASSSNGYCGVDQYGSFFDKTVLPVDGTSPWLVIAPLP